MDHRNVFKEAVLIQLATSCWVGTKTLQKGVVSNIGNSHWLRAKKLLVNPELLGAIKTVIHKSRQCIQRHSLPFPMPGLYLVPKDRIDEVDGELDYLKNEFFGKVNAFLCHYEVAREEAKIALGELFNESDYPMDIASKFRFDWRFLLLDIPDKASVLSPGIYEREKRKFEALMEETRELSIVALREEFGQIVQHLVERLTGNGDGPKTMRSDMTRKLNDFLADFGDKNLFEDQKLSELVEQAKEIVNGVDTPYALTYNEPLRQRFTTEMTHLKDSIDAAIEELPRRRIRFADPELVAA